MGFIRGELAKIPEVERVTVFDFRLPALARSEAIRLSLSFKDPTGTSWRNYPLSCERSWPSQVYGGRRFGLQPQYARDRNFPGPVTADSRGVPMTIIANAVSAMVGGLKLLPNKYTDKAGHRDDIQIKLQPELNQGPPDINNIRCRNVQGWTLFRFQQIVTSKPGSTLLTITRYNRERGISIFGNFVIRKISI